MNLTYRVILCFISINFIYTFTGFGQTSFIEKINEAKDGKQYSNTEQISNLLNLIPELDRSNHNDTLGMIHYYLKFRYDREGNTNQSHDHQEKAISLFNQSQLNTYMLGNMLIARGAEQQAIGQIEKAFSTFESIEKINDNSRRALLAKIESGRRRAQILASKGNYTAAVDLLEYIINKYQSDKISNRIYGALFMDLSISANNIRTQKYTIKANLAIEQFKLFNTDPLTQKFYEREKEVRYLMQKAFLHVTSGEHKEATKFYLAALRVSENQRNNFSQNVEYTKLLSNLSETHNLEHAYDKGLYFSKKAMASFNFFGSPAAKETESYLYANAADSYLGLENIDSAIYNIEKALSFYSVTDYKESPYKKQYAQLNIQRAKIYHQAFELTKDSSYLKFSFQQTSKINSIIDYYIQDQLFETSANIIKDTLQSFFNLGAELSYQLNQHDQFWNFAEKSKGLLLLNAIQSNQNNLDTIYDQLQYLRKEQTHIELLIYEAKSDIDSLQNVLTTNKKQQLDINRTLHSTETLHEFDVVSLDQIINNLSDQSIIHYQFTDSLLYAIALYKGVSSIHNLGNKNLIIQKISSFRNIIAKKSDTHEDQKLLNRLAFDLYELLIAPLSPLHHKLCIIPDQELNFLPFEVLSSASQSSEYLITNYNISYNISGSLYQNVLQGSNKITEVSMLSPSYDESRDNQMNLNPLPFAEFESKSILEVLELENRKYKITDKLAFTQSFSNADIIHFSGHAILDQANPEFSFLALSSKNNIGDRLSLAELYDTKSQAAMVVLSACNTGVGKILKGEGISNLTRGFFYSGSQSVIQTLWTVNEKSTASILIEFYKNIKAGQEKDDALRNAKLSYLKTSDDFVKHPYYWAGIVPLGNMEVLEFTQRSNLLFLSGFIFLLLLAFLLYRSMKNN